jgi:hypothetical protein
MRAKKMFMWMLHDEVVEEYEWINCLCKCYTDESEENVYVNVTRWSIRRVWVNKRFMWMLHGWEWID